MKNQFAIAGERESVFFPGMQDDDLPLPLQNRIGGDDPPGQRSRFARWGSRARLVIIR